MGKTAVADLHARLTADVTQYDGEMKRAAAVTQKTAADINGQMTQLQRNLSRKFSASDIGKDVLRGFGIGSGFALAQTAAEALTDHYKKQADFARLIEERTARNLEHTKAMIALGQSPEQRVGQAGKDRESAMREREQIVAGLQVGIPQYKGLDRVADLTIQRRETEDESQRIAELDKIIRSADTFLKQDEANKKAQESAGELANRVAAVTRAAREHKLLEGVMSKVRGEMDKHDETVKEMISGYEDIANPMRVYQRELEKINLLENANKLNAEAALAARKSLADAHFKGAPNNSGVSTMGPDAESNRVREIERYIEEMRFQGEEYMSRISMGGRVRVDDMTRRGMGTGANYGDWTKSVADILKEIRDALQRAIANMNPNIVTYQAD